MASFIKMALLLAFVTLIAINVVAARPQKFTIEDKPIGDLHSKVLMNTKTGEYAQVIVDFGGRIEDLVLKGRSSPLRSVLLTHDGNSTAIRENTWWKGALLIPYANRIDGGKYVFYNDTNQLPINEEALNNAIHGLLYNKTLNVELESGTKNEAILILSYQFDGKDQGYPFKLQLNISYILSEYNFEIRFRVYNPQPESPLLFYIGWHSYFKSSVYQTVITFDQCSKWDHILVNSRNIPTGLTTPSTAFDGTKPIGGTATNPTPFDDGYKAVSDIASCPSLKTKLYDPATKQTVVLYLDESFRYLQVFTGIVNATGEEAVAIEPMSAMTNAYNNHENLQILDSGETWSGAFGVYIE